MSRNASGIYYEVVEGTSIASPFFAGMLATWSAVSGHLYGFIDPELYRMASFFAVESSATGPPPPSIPSTPFLNVVQGSNYLFTAAPGWNAPTGWGGLDAVLFLSSSANATIANYTYDGPTPGLPPPLSVGPGTFLQYVVLFIGIAVATVAVVALTIGTRRPTMPPPTVYPSGGPMAPWPPGALTAGQPAAAGARSGPLVRAAPAHDLPLPVLRRAPAGGADALPDLRSPLGRRVGNAVGPKITPSALRWSRRGEGWGARRVASVAPSWPRAGRPSATG